jgi:uncharacterized protein
MFFGVALLIWTAMNTYFVWRLAKVPFIAQRLPRWILFGVAAVLWAAFPFSHAIEDSSSGTATQIIGIVGSYWLGVLFLLCVCLITADLITGFGFAFRKMASATRSWALILGSILALVAIVQGMRAPEIRKYELEVANLRSEYDGTVVVVASDLHLGGLTSERWLSSIVNQINTARPDIIVLAGDGVEGHGLQGRQSISALSRLAAGYGVWAVNGNHDESDEAMKSTAPVDGFLQNARIRVLRNQWAEVRPGFIMAGVDDLTARYRHGQSQADIVDRALAGRPPGVTIFISHSPLMADRVAADGANVMLSGHTHDGQIWPFNYFVRLTYPLMAGRYDVGGMPVFVCRGTGTWGPRMRLWHRSEILRITLRR